MSSSVINICLFALIGIFSVDATAGSLINAATPVAHFQIQMQNQSEKNVSISFEQGVGNVSLQPVLENQTPLLSNQESVKYRVYFDPLDPADTFHIVFHGKQNCTFTLGYVSPGNPKVSVAGLGCYGGGYRIIDSGYTVLLYISDIHR